MTKCLVLGLLLASSWSWADSSAVAPSCIDLVKAEAKVAARAKLNTENVVIVDVVPIPTRVPAAAAAQAEKSYIVLAIPGGTNEIAKNDLAWISVDTIASESGCTIKGSAKVYNGCNSPVCNDRQSPIL